MLTTGPRQGPQPWENTVGDSFLGLGSGHGAGLKASVDSQPPLGPQSQDDGPNPASHLPAGPSLAAPAESQEVCGAGAGAQDVGVPGPHGKGRFAPVGPR